MYAIRDRNNKMISVNKTIICRDNQMIKHRISSKIGLLGTLPMGPKEASARSSYPHTAIPGYSSSQYRFAAKSMSPTMIETTIMRKKMIEAGIKPPCKRKQLVQCSSNTAYAVSYLFKGVR